VATGSNPSVAEAMGEEGNDLPMASLKSMVLALFEDGEARGKARSLIDDLIAESRESGHNEAGHGQRIEIARLEGEVRSAKEALTKAQSDAEAKIAEMAAKIKAQPDHSEKLVALEADLKAREDELGKLRPVVETYQRTTLGGLIAKAARLTPSAAKLIASKLADDLKITIPADGKLTAEQTKALSDWASDPEHKDFVTPPDPAEPAKPAPAQPIAAPAPQLPHLDPSAKQTFVARPNLTPAAQAYIDRLPPGPAKDAAIGAYAKA